MGSADQISTLSRMMKKCTPNSLSPNPTLRGTSLPKEDTDDSEAPARLRRGSSEKLRKGKSDNDSSETPHQLRRGSSEKVRRGSDEKDNSEPIVRMRRVRTRPQTEEEEVLIEGRRASWGYCGSKVLKARPLSDRVSKIDIKPADVIQEKEENAVESEKDSLSPSSARNMRYKEDSLKNGSPQSNQGK